MKTRERRVSPLRTRTRGAAVGAAVGAAAFVWVGVIAAADSLTEKPAPKPVAAEPLVGAPLALRVLPERVYTSTPIRLRLAPPAELEPVGEIRWRCESGLLLYDDLREVEWKPPSASAKVRVSVEFTTGGGKRRRIDRSITVREPSTDGMVWVPRGVFRRGDVTGTNLRDQDKTAQNLSDEPDHDVSLDGYWIDRHPVTNAAYCEFLNDAYRQGLVGVEGVGVFGAFEGAWTPFYYFRSYEELVADFLKTVNPRTPDFLHLIGWDAEARRFFVRKPETARSPVVDVTWAGAAAFARYYGRRLPTEAQWERAARGDDGRRYPWGNRPPTVYDTNVNFHRGVDPQPIGSFPGGDSPFGVADMVSGYFEWSGDWFNLSYYDDHRAPVPLANPTGPFWGEAHAVRGQANAVFYPSSLLDVEEPVATRYHWTFEFFVGDMFANSETTFRTAYVPGPDELRYEDPF